jgi:hypothetical protein
MTPSKGFLVVLRPSVSNKGLNNPEYRGLDRTPPWSMEMFARGFDDPYVYEDFITPEGLIPTLALALQVQSEFAKVYDLKDTETIYVQTPGVSGLRRMNSPDMRFLGYDVAGAAPFWSIVGDCPPLSDSNLGRFLAQLNADGLFDSRELTADYFAEHLRHHSEGRDQGLEIWEVYLVKDVREGNAR